MRQLFMVLWKNIYLKRLSRHLVTTVLEIVLMVVLLLGIQDDAVVREPFLRKGDTIFRPIQPTVYWNTQKDMADITTVYFAPDKNPYTAQLTRAAMKQLGVPAVIALASGTMLRETMRKANKLPARTVGILYKDVNQSHTVPVSLHVSFYGGILPFDVNVHFPERLLAQPQGPSAEERFPELNTLLPVIATLQQHHLDNMARLMNRTHLLAKPASLQRAPYPAHIAYQDTKNYAFVLTRFCIGMLAPFSIFVARLCDEKSTGMKEMLRLVGLNDCVYWFSHYLSGFFMHVVISALMMLFLCVKRNAEGRAFIQYSDPLLVFCILMCFCSSCLMHATMLSTFFANPHSAVAAAMLYWTCTCVVPFLALENAGGNGYFYIKREDKLYTAIFPGMNLHWSFRVLERFEKFVERGANWFNFYDHDSTPDNVTLAEIVFVGFLCDCIIVVTVWYVDNVLHVGPGISLPYHYPLKMSYWIPSRTMSQPPAMTVQEVPNFEPEPRDLPVAIDIVNASKDYNGIVAVQDARLRVFKNQITVLLGHNGAGKTTLLNMITGFTNVTSGSISVDGYDISENTRDARASIGYCPQDNILFDDLTVEEHLLFFAVVKGTPYQEVRKEIVTLLHDVGLIHYRSELAADLSLGLQRRLCTAVAIVSTPKVIILDEPTANMDPESRREMWELLLKIRRDSTIFLTTQHLDEADVLGDRIVIMANARFRCAGSTEFLTQRFGAGYHMQINKLPECKVGAIETLLRQYAPKAKLRSDSKNEAVFILGEIVRTRRIITMFKDIEQQSGDLGIESVGLAVTSLEDVIIRVGEDHHVHQHKQEHQQQQEQESMIETRPSMVQAMATRLSSDPGCRGRMWALLSKRSTSVWRHKKQLLFSWLLPPLILVMLFKMEEIALRGSSQAQEHVGDTLAYTFREVLTYPEAFVSADPGNKLYDDYITPAMKGFYVLPLTPGSDITKQALDFARKHLQIYVFNVHFGIELHKENGTFTLWYNGEIQHTALLTLSLYNNARLRQVTGDANATFGFDVTVVDRASPSEEELVKSQNTYRELVPKVLRAIFLPLVSSLMCSNFVVFPIIERALQVKHLHTIAGISPSMYWSTNFLWDFMFYMGTAVFVLPPIAYYQAHTLTFDDIQLIFILNILHGSAALPFIYLCSFLFDNAGYGFSTLAVSLFLISMLAALGREIIQIYALESSPLAAIIETLVQIARLVPCFSYSYGMSKLLQLAHENAICSRGGQELHSACHTRTVANKLSLQQCCKYQSEPDPSQYAIHPLDGHPYSVFYEVLTLCIEGPVLFALLLLLDGSWLRRIDRKLSTPGPEDSEPEPTAGGGTMKATKKEDTDVVQEDRLVMMCSNKQPPPGSTMPAMLVCRLNKAYGYLESHSVLRDLTFSVKAGECFGLLGVNGVGKTTTFRILTGEILPHRGDAVINGFSVVNNLPQFQRYLGYCPQRDGLLDMLTGVETLRFYSRLRGITLSREYLETLLHIFGMEEIADQLVATYSGGNRRKLSLCVSLLGMPNMALLDEPYDGMGATSRKRIVNYISSLQRVAKISILLSSHSLSDVEFLCNRIAIMGDGKLQCLGSLAHLKDKFGQGHTITVQTYPDRKQDVFYLREVASAVTYLFKEAELVHTYQGQLEFRMSRVKMLWSEMFTRMALIKKRFKLRDFYITDTSLEQIFSSVTRKEAFEAAVAAQAPKTGHSTIGI